MKKQVTAVVDEVKNALGTAYDINTPSANVLTKEQLTTIQDNIFDGLANGDIEYKGDRSDTKKLKTYAKGLVTNHLRKAKPLNGNVAYKASGTGPKRDERLRELNNLIKCGKFDEGTEEHDAIVQAIADRKAELAKKKSTERTKSKASQIDTSVLPAELQGLATPDSE